MILNLILLTSAVVVGFFAYDYYRKCKRSSDINNYLLMTGIACSIWNIGYGFLGFSEDLSHAAFWRAVGIFGFDSFMIGVSLWMNYKAGMKKRGRFIIAGLYGLFALADVRLFGVKKEIFFDRARGRSFYIGGDFLGMMVHAVFTIALLIIIIVFFVRWRRNSYFRRDRKFRKIVALSIVLMSVINLCEFVLTSQGIPFPPISPFGGAVIYLCFTYMANRFINYDISKQNVSKYLYQNGNTLVLAFDMDRHLAVANPVAKEFFGMDQVQGQRISELFDLEGLSEKVLFDRARQGEECFRFRDLKRGVACSLYLNVALDRNGEPYCYMCAIYDMTEEDNMIRQLRDASEAKSSFLANMSHEIRTPINAILGMNEMILREASDRVVLDYAERMQESGKELLSTVNEILDYSKLESGKMEVLLSEYNLSAVLTELGAKLYEEASKKKLEVRFEINSMIPDLLMGDEIKISQIIENLISNACKYTDKGSVTLRADYSRDGEDGIILLVEVIDTGKGILPEDQVHIFDAFEWADQKRSKNVEGNGLGLAISGQYTHMMKGKINLSSKYGEGSTFSIRLPQKVVSFDPIGDYESRLDMYRKEKENSALHSFRAPYARILVADDNEMNLQVVQLLLRKNDVQIDTAMSGKEALRMIRDKEYHMIFLDHLMPEMDGVETLREIRERGLCDRVPIIALTANAVSGARAMYMDYGFTDYLPKPILGTDLERLLLTYLPSGIVIRERNLMEEVKQEQASEIVLEAVEDYYEQAGADYSNAKQREDRAKEELTHIFIINPVAGKGNYANRIRKKIERRKDIRSFVFFCPQQGKETDIVRKLQHYFNKGKLRIYSIGGSGTARNILNGIEDFERVELAVCPMGLTNDFLKVIGEEDRFRDIDNLIDGNISRIDYIKTNHGLALNTFSLGFDSIIVKKVEQHRTLRVFGNMLPYAIAFLYAIFRAKPADYEIFVDDQFYEGKMGEIFYGNGCVLGGSMHFATDCKVKDGKANFLIARNFQGVGTVPLVLSLAKNKQEEVEKYGVLGLCDTITIRRKDDRPFEMNFDGELVGDVTEWKAQIVREGLSFVLPKGVEIHG